MKKNKVKTKRKSTKLWSSNTRKMNTLQIKKKKKKKEMIISDENSYTVQ